ncbi:patatin like esterase [Cryptosporidium ryanae]|uniref:patatin like esterase n=1 Tax=Cryptosporidium ryanae TaxID=515981 RepID=UPI00351A0FEF|nr:patatin like esterase [Cryptosporidium ryanae]
MSNTRNTNSSETDVDPKLTIKDGSSNLNDRGKRTTWKTKLSFYTEKLGGEKLTRNSCNLEKNIDLNALSTSFESNEKIETNVQPSGSYFFWPNSFEEIQRGSSAVLNRLASRIEEGIQDLQFQLRPDFPKLSERLGDKEIPIGFSFSVSAMLIPYHLGVILELQEQGYLTDSTPLSGASGGSIAAVCCALGISVYEAMDACISLYEDCRKNGTAGRLNNVLERELRKKIPDNAVELLRKRAEKGGQTIISYTQVLPVPKSHFVSDFTSKDDLIECILASSTIPFLSVPWPTFKCRGKACVDGFFAVGRSELGCIPTNSRRTVKVCPLPSAGSSMKSKRSDVISPHIQNYDWILFNSDDGKSEFDLLRTRSWISKIKPYSRFSGREDIDEASDLSTSENSVTEKKNFFMGKSASEDLNNEFEERFFNNNTNLNAPPIMKYTNNELLRIAVDPPSTKVAWELFYVGRGDALRWVMIDRIKNNSEKFMEPISS